MELGSGLPLQIATAMRIIFFLVSTIFCCLTTYSQTFQLAAPLLDCSSAYFSDRTSISLRFNEPGTSIHYTLDGSEPTKKSPIYKEPIIITKNTAFRARSFGDLFLPSTIVAMDLVKTGLPVQEINFTSANEKYSSDKKNILHDAIGGIPKLNDGNWLGYNKDSAVITVELKNRSKVKKILLGFLQDQGSWIFLPEKIRVFAFNEATKKYSLLSQRNFRDIAAAKKYLQVEIAATQPIITKQLRIVLHPLKKIPEWHDGKGSVAWLFVDEINVY